MYPTSIINNNLIHLKSILQYARRNYPKQRCLQKRRISTIKHRIQGMPALLLQIQANITSTSSLSVPQGVATDGCTSWGSLLRHSIGIGNGLYLYSMALGHCINVLITCINRGWSEILVAWPQCRAVLARRCFVKSRPP